MTESKPELMTFSELPRHIQLMYVCAFVERIMNMKRENELEADKVFRDFNHFFIDPCFNDRYEPLPTSREADVIHPRIKRG